jgi:hypothetical protein
MDESYDEYIIPNGIVYPGKATSPVVCPGHNRAKVVWLRGNDPKVIKARVYWNNYTDSIEINVPQDVDTISCLIGPLEENTYTFIIRTYDLDGNVSIPVEVTGDVYGDIYQGSLFNRTITGEEVNDQGKWTINWESVGKNSTAIATEMEYITNDKIIQQLIIPVSANVTEITNQKPGAGFQYRTLYLPDSLAIDTFYTAYIAGEIPLSPVNKSGWTVTASSDARDTQAPNGAPEKVIDGDNTTFWHSKHKPSSPGYPHWLAFDMKKEVEVWQVQLTHRQSYPEQSFKGFTIQGSNDGANWVNYGSFTMLPQALVTQTFDIESKPRIRYIRVYMDVPGTTVHAHLGEFSVVGFYTE